jgi:RNA polymerase sigma factor (sigma-70 family)
VTEIHKSLYEISVSVAVVITRRFKSFVEYQDVVQECLAWSVARNRNFEDQLNEPDNDQRLINEKRIAYQMRRAAERYARKEKAARSGYHISDESYYDTTTLAQLLPFVLASIINETTIEVAQNMVNDGQPRKPSAPAEGGNLLNILIDIKRSFLKLEEDDKTLLRLRYFDDQTLQQMAQYLECAVSTADRRCQSALRKLQNLLGGDSPWS